MDRSASRYECAYNVGLSLVEIEECLGSDLGIELQLMDEQVTAPIIGQSHHVPTIVFNEIYNSHDDFEAQSNFLAVVERKLENP